MKITEEQLRNLVREELLREGSEKTLVKTTKMPAEEMLNNNEPFTVIGYSEDEVEVNRWNSLITYRVGIKTAIQGNVSDDTMIKVAQAIMPKIYPKGVMKNEKVIEVIKSKGQSFNMGDIYQTLVLTLPENIQVVYK